MQYAPPPYSCTDVRTLKSPGTTSDVVPSGSRRTRTTRPRSAARPSSHQTTPSSIHGADRRTPASATISAEIGEDHVPKAATVFWLTGAPTAAAMVLRHAGDQSRSVGDADGVHEERGPAATRARGGGVRRLLRPTLRRGRGLLARDRAPPRLRLRDPSHARRAPAGRSADSA